MTVLLGTLVVLGIVLIPLCWLLFWGGLVAFGSLFGSWFCSANPVGKRPTKDEMLEELQKYNEWEGKRK